MNYNKVILMGRMTAEPRLKLTESGLDVCEFGLAINRKTKEPEPDEVCFIDCTAFGKTAGVIGKHFAKGEPILIEGRLKFRQWGGQSGKAEKNTRSLSTDSSSLAASVRATRSRRQHLNRPCQVVRRSPTLTFRFNNDVRRAM